MDNINDVRTRTLTAVENYVETVRAAMQGAAPALEAAMEQLFSSDTPEAMKLAIFKECNAKLEALGETGNAG